MVERGDLMIACDKSNKNAGQAAVQGSGWGPVKEGEVALCLPKSDSRCVCVCVCVRADVFMRAWSRNEMEHGQTGRPRCLCTRN
jgi:hypothetical protein